MEEFGFSSVLSCNNNKPAAVIFNAFPLPRAINRFIAAVIKLICRKATRHAMVNTHWWHDWILHLAQKMTTILPWYTVVDALSNIHIAFPQIGCWLLCLFSCWNASTLNIGSRLHEMERKCCVKLQIIFDEFQSDNQGKQQLTDWRTDGLIIRGGPRFSVSSKSITRPTKDCGCCCCLTHIFGVPFHRAFERLLLRGAWVLLRLRWSSSPLTFTLQWISERFSHFC